MLTLKYFQRNDQESGTLNFKAVLIGVISAAITAGLLIVLFSLLLLYTGLPQSFIPYIAKGILFFSTFLGGIFSGRLCSTNGWLYGLFSGLVFVILILIAGLISGIRESITFSVIPTIIITVIISALSGVVGINNKPKRRKQNKH